ISIPIIAGSFIIRKNLILLLSNELYMDAAILIPLLTGGLLIYGAYYFISAGFFLSNKTKNLGYLIIIISFLNIILSLILGKIIGVLGVTISTVVSYIIFMLATYFLGKKTLTLKIDYTILLNFSLKSIVMIIIVRLIPVVDLNILSLIIKILVSVFIYLLLNVGYIKKNIMGGKKQW
ncbi:MAG: polysaccharide biosynthesis C-terminal domain-containing protein, partial [Acholeplasma sp.]|nr:polysaccharide biosynthesis C-terminal domain-containing protein [Acholeplasma sp.]